MAERIVSMHAAYKSGKEAVDGFLSRPTAGDPRTAIGNRHVSRVSGKSKEKYEMEMYDGAGRAFSIILRRKAFANREAAAKSVIKTSKWLRKNLA